MESIGRRVSKSKVKTRNNKIVIRNRNQITIPREYAEYVGIGEGEELKYEISDDGALILRPVITVPKDQAWFWTKKWQAEEREVDEEIKTGQISAPQNLEDFIHDLEKL
ncbi:AbrB/MazE/SpoVT family DNA-binding domain-containing protein [Desulfosporosinus sp. OT]|uniref:AbrB/MazE/SpoVT family DNA-binding domain-containing protein n=1 Tax=Desulfosporosinus sp. OT TaxID=913865 RepID=UPI000223A30C|nr:AbrB/MazE/SpoVT family DNA-binding domain-containing protein [Desulfosporosinus sp. OT]EGW37797.1 spoVT / AbrB like domain protein [Desulfosporosinus sp. OT]